MEESIFSKAINEMIGHLKESNYPTNAFDYKDQFVTLHMRRQPPCLVQMAIYNEDTSQVLINSHKFNDNLILVLENIEVAEQYRGRGYLKELIKTLSSTFNKYYICITNVYNSRLSEWLTNQDKWKGTAYMGPPRTQTKLIESLRQENFVLLDNKSTII